MVNFYRRFVPSAAHILQPLYQATAGKPKQLQWTEENISAFERTKEALASAILLAYPQANAPIAVTVDASSVAVGAAPEQLLDDSWQPLTFFSKALRPAEKKYSTFDRELPAVYLAVRHFRYYLEGRDFTVFTDHKPLTFAFAKYQSLGQPDNSDIWPQFQSTPPVSAHSRKDQSCGRCTVAQFRPGD